MRPKATPERKPASPLRVLVPYITTYGGGVRTVLRAGLPRLATRAGIEIVYAELCRNGPDMDEMERSGVRVEREAGVIGSGVLSSRGGLRRVADLAAQLPRLTLIALRLAKRLADYDVCYVHGHRELFLAIAARALVPSVRRPAIVWHWHGPPLSLAAGADGSRAGRRIARLGSGECARVIAISPFCAQQMERMGVELRRISTVVNAAEVAPPPAQTSATTPPLPARAPGEFVSLVPCASIRGHKGVHVAIDALRHLPSRHVLWITGDRSDSAAGDYLAELDAAVARSGLVDRVRFIGVRRDIHRVMEAADAVVVPSVWEEPFGLVAAEAQLVGTPVVTSNRGALPDVVVHGELGLVFDPDDPANLAAALIRLASSDGERENMARVAQRQAVERYSYERWANEVAAILEDVVASSRARRRARQIG